MERVIKEKEIIAFARLYSILPNREGPDGVWQSINLKIILNIEPNLNCRRGDGTGPTEGKSGESLTGGMGRTGQSTVCTYVLLPLRAIRVR